MISLLRADLQVLFNLPRHKDGYPVLFAHAFSIFLLISIGNIITKRLFREPMLFDLLDGPEGAWVAQALFALLMVPVAMQAVWMGMETAKKLWFEGAHLELLLNAPLSGFSVAAYPYFRALFFSTLWGFLLCGPMAHRLLQTVDSPGYAIYLLPIAVWAASTVPLTIIMILNLFFMRWFASPRMKLFLNVLFALVSISFSIFMGTAFFAGDSLANEALKYTQGKPELPALLSWPAALLGNTFDGGQVLLQTWLRAGGLILIGPLFMAVFCRWYRRAYENERIAIAPLLRPKGAKALSKGWPVTMHASFFRKDVAMLFQQPGRLFGFFALFVIGFLIVRYPEMSEFWFKRTAIPAGWQQTFALLTFWFLSMMMVLPSAVNSVVFDEAKQWPLIMASPLTGWQFLRGKLRMMAVYLSLPLALILPMGGLFLDFSLGSLIYFVILALFGSFLLIGLGLVVGTCPLFHSGLRNGNPPNMWLAMLAHLLVYFFLLLVGKEIGMEAWKNLELYYRAGLGPLEEYADSHLAYLHLAGLITLSLLIGGAGLFVSSWSVNRLLRAAT